MMRIMMKSKIHRATVTQADLHYVGSVTLDAALMEAADLLEGEQVAIVDITNGAWIETYVITAPRGSVPSSPTSTRGAPRGASWSSTSRPPSSTPPRPSWRNTRSSGSTSSRSTPSRQRR